MRECDGLDGYGRRVYRRCEKERMGMGRRGMEGWKVVL